MSLSRYRRPVTMKWMVCRRYHFSHYVPTTRAIRRFWLDNPHHSFHDAWCRHRSYRWLQATDSAHKIPQNTRRGIVQRHAVPPILCSRILLVSWAFT